MVIIDIRTNDKFKSGTFPTAINLPASDAFARPNDTVALYSLKLGNPSSLALVRARGKSLIVICGEATADAQEFAAILMRLGYPKVCCLSGGFNSLDQIGATLTVPSVSN